MLNSEKINKFFEENEDIDGFWDWVHEKPFYDEQQWDEDEKWDLFDKGFNLARKAGDQPIYEYSTEDASLQLYFIGNESAILKRLNKFLKDFLKKYPPEDEKTKKHQKLLDEREKLQRELRLTQANINFINAKLEENGSE
jgi:hypothetical protein